MFCSTRPGRAKCIDLTAAAASAAVGKSTTIKLSPLAPLAGLSICDVKISGEVYPVQLAVNTNNAALEFKADMQASSGINVRGLGDQAFHRSIGVETLSGGTDIKVTGPAGPVLNGNFAVPTAIARAMIVAIK